MFMKYERGEKLSNNTTPKMLKIEAVCLLVDCSVYTINLWYRWKRKNPDDELAKLLPDFYQDGDRQTRYWRTEDISKLIEFKNKLPKGRNGILGSITQKYNHKKIKGD